MRLALVLVILGLPGDNVAPRAEEALLLVRYRMGQGGTVLRADQRLNAAAQAHADDMATRRYFSHRSPEGRWHTDRLRAAGLDPGWSGEIIAWGQATAPQVVGDWVRSPGHHDRIVDPHYARLGVGCAVRPGGRPYWVAVFTSDIP